MATVTIPKKEYESLRQYHAAYVRIVEEIAKAERAYPYDYKYIGRLTRKAKKEKWFEAKSVDGALAKMKRRWEFYTHPDFCDLLRNYPTKFRMSFAEGKIFFSEIHSIPY